MFKALEPGARGAVLPDRQAQALSSEPGLLPTVCSSLMGLTVKPIVDDSLSWSHSSVKFPAAEHTQKASHQDAHTYGKSHVKPERMRKDGCQKAVCLLTSVSHLCL